MKKTIRAALVATAMSAVTLVPAATVVSVATVDAAYAKGGNGNGGGNGGGNGQASESRGGGNDKSARGSGGGKPSWAGSGERGGSAAQRGGPDPVGDFFRKVTGQDKKQVRQASRIAATKGAPETSIQPANRPEGKLPGSRAAQLTGLHPSELGNMNGALNANINAVLAHMESGNFNGPVGHMAAVAMASAGAAEADSFLSSPEGMEYSAFQRALEASPYETYDAYLAAVENGEAPVNVDLENAHAALGTSRLAEALGDYPDYQSYLDAKKADPLLADSAIEDAHAALGMIDPDALDLYGAANEELGSLTNAQDALIAYWNKNDPESAEDDEKLLAGVMAHIEENSAAISETLAGLEADAGEAATSEGVEDELAECTEPEACEPGEDSPTLASAD